jgi:hypothetical protein
MLTPLVFNAGVMRKIGVFGVDDNRGWAMGRKFLSLLKESRVKHLWLESVWEKRCQGRREPSQGRAEINLCDRFWYAWWDGRFRYVKITVGVSDLGAWGVDEEGFGKKIDMARDCAERLVGEDAEVVVGAKKESVVSYGTLRWEKMVVVMRKTY